MKKTYLLLAVAHLLPLFSYSQFTTPTIDGSIGASEYGVHTDGQNQNTNGSSVWYCSWDNTNVYFAVAGGYNASSDAINIYLDVNPADLVNDGTGLTTGATYDGVTPDLPFSADAYLFVKSGYKDRNTVSGASWSSASGGSSNITDWVNTGTNVIEFSVPWSSLGVASRPSAFNWTGYISYSGGGGGCFGHVPTANPGGNTPDFVRYYTADTTANGSSVQPFEKESYCHVGASIGSFGGITIYDFTMNTSGATLTRTAGVGNDWNINGDFKVGDGMVDFDASTSACTVSGLTKTYLGGTLSLANGASLMLEGDFENLGSFNPYGVEVSFSGSTQQTISGTLNGTGNVNNLSGLKLDNSDGLLLDTDVAIEKYSTSVCRLAFTTGVLELNGNELYVDDDCSYLGAFSSSNMIDARSGYIRQELSATGSRLYPVGGSGYSPLTVDFTSGTFSAGAYVDVNVTESKHPSNSSTSNYLNRYWTINSIGISSFSSDIKMEYPSSDVIGVESSIYAAKFSSSLWTLGAVNSTAGELDFNSNTSFSDFTGGESAFLPVSLLAFSGELNNNKIELNWSTASELNTSNFELMKMVSGSEKLLATMPAAGTSNEVSFYSCVDHDILAQNVYALYSNDYDGHREFLGTVMVKSDQESINIYGSDGHINITSSTPINRVEVYDLSGKLIEKLEVSNTQIIELNPLSKGPYLIQIFSSNSLVHSEVFLLK